MWDIEETRSEEEEDGEGYEDQRFVVFVGDVWWGHVLNLTRYFLPALADICSDGSSSVRV